jgi:Flagellar hook-length control protein FliK
VPLQGAARTGPAAPYNPRVIKPPDSSVSKVGAVTPGSPIERVRGDVGRLLVAVQQAGAPATPFVIGENVSARLVEPLQNRQWLAVVKNTVITLQLPANAPVPTQGGTLPLQVVALTPRLAFALVDSAATAPAHGAVAVQLSAAAQTMSALVQSASAQSGLLQAGAQAALPTLASAPVLLANPLAPPAERAQAVAQAVVHGGLFYESHLLAWTEGRMPLARLDTEPQARLQRALRDTAPSAREAAGAELGGVLQRQLDALDGKPLAFAGFAWPGQPAQWRIEREAPEARGDDAAQERAEGDADAAPAWTTQLQLDLPHLGALGARLRVAGTQVTLAMTLDSHAGADLLATHRQRLAASLQAAGLTLSALTVQRTTTDDVRAKKA